MVWPFTSGKNEDTEATKGDAYRDLDPSLRKFLEKESPVKYNPPTPQPPPPTAQSSPGSETKSSTNPKSLYPDGRYNHLWSTYRPLSEIENETKSDQEKLLDVLAAYKDRKAGIGRAAIENCADVHLTLNECFRNGNFGQRANMCRHETKALDRCYKLNTQFLKALGYLSSYDRPAEVDEQIQMHADKLYNRMLAQERQIEEAKAAGLEPPAFPSIFSPAQPSPSTASPAGSTAQLSPRPLELDLLTPQAKATLKERTKNMTPEQRDIEERAFAAELRAGIETSENLDRHRAEVKAEKEARRAKGEATLGDRVSSIFGW